MGTGFLLCSRYSGRACVLLVFLLPIAPPSSVCLSSGHHVVSGACGELVDSPQRRVYVVYPPVRLVFHLLELLHAEDYVLLCLLLCYSRHSFISFCMSGLPGPLVVVPYPPFSPVSRPTARPFFLYLLVCLHYLVVSWGSIWLFIFLISASVFIWFFTSCAAVSLVVFISLLISSSCARRSFISSPFSFSPGMLPFPPLAFRRS